MDTLRKSTKWYVSVIISVLFFVCAAIYFGAVEGLNKPAELEDAYVFLFNYPREYTMCLIFGTIAKAAGLAILVIAIGASFCLINSFVQDKVFYYEESKIKDIINCVVNWILVVVTTIAQDKIIVDLGVLLLSLALIIGIIWLYTKGK